VAQKDTLYFKLDTVWRTNWLSSSKKDAEFYRPMPLKKVGDLYQVKDYYTNGQLQMEGFCTHPTKDIYHGKAIWYYKNGNIEQEFTYKNGERNGLSKTYFKDGTLKTEGTYKNGEAFNGTFEDCCPYATVDERKEGKRIASYRYYKDSKVIAEKTINDKDEHTNKILAYNKKGEQIAELSVKPIEKYIDGKRIRFHIDNDKNILNIEAYENYKNSRLEGECVEFDLKGNQIAQGIYKDGSSYSGTFLDYSILKTYIDGKLEGEEIAFEKEKVIAKGINKNGGHWKGQFKITDNTIASHKNGQLEGKTTTYYTDSFGYYLGKIKSYHHIKNKKKEGESAYFNEKGEQIAQGTYKNDEPFTGAFYDDYRRTLTSYKEGKKHGFLIQYGWDGKIIAKQEYHEDQITGLVKREGMVDNRICECQYKKGKPFDGEVCHTTGITYYQNGLIIKDEFYDYNYDTEQAILSSKFLYDNKRNIIAKTFYVDDKTYTITFKDGKPYNGAHYAHYNGETITFKNGKKEGPFSNLENQNKALQISGNYKNNLWEGIIIFKETDLNLETSCLYKEGKPIDGTAIDKHTITPYKKGKKNGTEKTVQFDAYAENPIKTIKITEYNKGVPLHETWPEFKNDKGKIVEGVYKDGTPFNGTFFEFKPATGTLSQYKKGVIIDNQYHGYNDKNSLLVTDTLRYKAGKPYQGKGIEYYKGKIHEHHYSKGEVIKTLITDDVYRDRIRATVTYNDTGYVVTDKDSDLIMLKVSYVDQTKTKAKGIVYSDIDELAGSFEYHGNKVTVIDIKYTKGDYKISYTLENDTLLITVKNKDLLMKLYPKLESRAKFTYKNFLNPEELFTDGEAAVHTYIDGKHLLSGVFVNNDMYDGEFVWGNSSNTYSYLKLNKGGSLERKDELSKKELILLIEK
jgi:antitoxin component YwqK of YwqJK toxin-antitoxin module